MKYMDFNGLDSAFDVDPIYFWSMSHQTLLVSMSHPSFTPLVSKEKINKYINNIDEIWIRIECVEFVSI